MMRVYLLEESLQEVDIFQTCGRGSFQLPFTGLLSAVVEILVAWQQRGCPVMRGWLFFDGIKQVSIRITVLVVRSHILIVLTFVIFFHVSTQFTFEVCRQKMSQD